MFLSLKSPLRTSAYSLYEFNPGELDEPGKAVLAAHRARRDRAPRTVVIRGSTSASHSKARTRTFSPENAFAKASRSIPRDGSRGLSLLVATREARAVWTTASRRRGRGSRRLAVGLTEPRGRQLGGDRGDAPGDAGRLSELFKTRTATAEDLSEAEQPSPPGGTATTRSRSTARRPRPRRRRARRSAGCSSCAASRLDERLSASRRALPRGRATARGREAVRRLDSAAVVVTRCRARIARPTPRRGTPPA